MCKIGKSPSTHFWCNWKQATIPTSSPGGSRRATDSFLGQFGMVCRIVFLCSNSSVFVSPKLIFSWEMAKHIFFFLKKKYFGQSRTFFDWSRTFFDRSRTYFDQSRTFSIGVELFSKFYSNGKKFYSDQKKFYCTPKKVLNFGIFRWTWVLKSIYRAVNFGCWRSTINLITTKLADVDDLFVRKDLLHRYNVDREMAEEFKKIFSFDPLDSKEHDGYKV